jgi:hypothetical protein
MMSGPLVNGSSQTAAPFQFPFIVLLRHGRGAIFNLQPSSSSPPSTSIHVTNFIPLQLQSSLPTSSLVAIQIPNPVVVLFPPFSLMVAAVCLMLLVPDELLTKIIIHLLTQNQQPAQAHSKSNEASLTHVPDPKRASQFS